MSYKQLNAPYNSSDSFAHVNVPVYKLYGYDSLTHDNAQQSNGSGYFEIMAGYKCPIPVNNMKPGTVVMRNRPQPVNHASKYHVIEQFNNLKKLKVDMYHTDSCGYCKAAKDMLKKAKADKSVTLKSLSNAKHAAEFRKMNARGVPLFVSNKTKKSHAGLPKSVHDLVAKLS